MKSAMQRIETIIDNGSLFILGNQSASQHIDLSDRTPHDGVITGFAKVHGVTVAIIAEDKTALGLTDAQVAQNKQQRMLVLAVRRKLPIIYLSDHPGKSHIQEHETGDLVTRSADQRFYLDSSYCRGPLIIAFFGERAGLGAQLSSNADIVIDNNFIQWASRKEEFKNFYQDPELGVLNSIKKLIYYIGYANLEVQAEDKHSVNGDIDNCGRDVSHSAREAFNLIIDSGTAVPTHFESEEFFGAVGMLFGKPLSVVIAGSGQSSLTTSVVQKLRSFLEFTMSANLPLLIIQDCAGYDEKDAFSMEFNVEASKCADMLSKYSGPKLVLITGKGQVLGNYILGGRRLGIDYIATWPWAEVSLQSLETYRAADISGAISSGPWLAAGRGIIDDIILPSETRSRLSFYLSLLYNSTSLPKVSEDTKHRPLATMR